MTNEVLTIRKGEFIAQLILERILTPEVIEVEELDETTRGSGGFGSTNVIVQAQVPESPAPIQLGTPV